VTQSYDYIVFRSLQESLQLRGLGPSIGNKYQYLILTGYNNMTMYVFARNFTQFMKQYKTHVEHVVATWKYTGKYKSLQSSYYEQCVDI